MTQDEFFKKALPKFIWISNNFPDFKVSGQLTEYENKQNELFRAIIWFTKHYPVGDFLEWLEDAPVSEHVKVLYPNWLMTKICGKCKSTNISVDQTSGRIQCFECKLPY